MALVDEIASAHQQMSTGVPRLSRGKPSRSSISVQDSGRLEQQSVMMPVPICQIRPPPQRPSSCNLLCLRPRIRRALPISTISARSLFFRCRLIRMGLRFDADSVVRCQAGAGRLLWVVTGRVVERRDMCHPPTDGHAAITPAPRDDPEDRGKACHENRRTPIKHAIAAGSIET